MWQFRLKTLLAVVTLAAIACWGAWVAWPRYQEYQALERVREIRRVAQDSMEVGRANVRLEQTLSPRAWNRLLDDPDQGLALRAAYEAFHVRNAKGDRSSVAPFIAYLRDEVDLRPPGWWLEALLGEFKVQGYRSWPFEHGEVVVCANRGVCYFDATTLHDTGIDAVRRQVARELATGKAYLASCDAWGSGFEVGAVVFDDTAGLNLWHARVWAAGERDTWQADAGHCVELIANDRELLVWGATPDCLYVEAFDANSGRNRLRFATNDWGTR